MTEYFCSRCQILFEASLGRCPKCLRTSTVLPTSDMKDQGTENGSLGLSLLRWLIRFGMGALFFFLLTISGSLLGLKIEKTWMRVFAVVLGGLLLSFAWGLFPKLDPARKVRGVKRHKPNK